jgi:DNA-binding GntR family transcriptional regulator
MTATREARRIWLRPDCILDNVFDQAASSVRTTLPPLAAPRWSASSVWRTVPGITIPELPMPRQKAVVAPPVRATASSVAATPRRVMPIQRQTLTGMTLDALRERILHGEYPEGEPLRQDAIAEELGVSRIPVREALRQLEAEGLVTFSPHRGAVVSTMSLQEIAELFELRAEIESDLVRRAIPHMTAEDHARAKEILLAYEIALRGGEVSKYGELNWQFHSTLYAPAARAFTMSMVGKLHQQSDRYLRMQLALTHGETRAKDEHRAIAAAAKRADVRAAAKLMREHILGAGRSLLTFLEGQRGEKMTKPRRQATS